jgi:hypothetical protein
MSTEGDISRWIVISVVVAIVTAGALVAIIAWLYQ